MTERARTACNKHTRRVFSRVCVRIKVGTCVYLLCSLFSMHPVDVAQVITRLSLAAQQWRPVKLKLYPTICKSVVFRAIYNLSLYHL